MAEWRETLKTSLNRSTEFSITNSVTSEKLFYFSWDKKGRQKNSNTDQYIHLSYESWRGKAIETH